MPLDKIHADEYDFRIEEELRNRDYWLSESQRITHIGSWMWDIATESLVWSEETYRIYGVNPDSFIPSIASLLALLHVDDRPAMQAWIHACLSGEQPSELEFRAVMPDGKVLTLQGHGDLQYNADYTPIRMLGTVKDITERKQMEQELLDSNSFNISVLDSLSSAIAVLDAQGVIMAVNKAWQQFGKENGLQSNRDLVAANYLGICKTCDTPKNDCTVCSLGISYLDTCKTAINQPNGDEASAAYLGIVAVLAGEKDTFHLEYSCHSPTQQRWFSMNVSALQGSRRGAVVSHENITERKQAEIRQQGSEEKLSLFIHYAPSAIAMFDCDMRYLAFSHRWLVDYDLGEQELLGRIHYDVFPDMPEQWKEVHRRSLNGAVEKCDEDMFERANGSVEWVRWETRPWRSSQGNIGGIIIFSEVITERKQAEEKAQTIAAKLEAALASMSDAVFISDTEGSFINFNDAFVTFHRFKNKDECPKILTEYPKLVDVYLLTGEFVPLEQRPVSRALCGETAINTEFILHRKDTDEKWIGSYNYAPILDDGVIIGSVVTARDITERKQAEKKLQLAANVFTHSNDGIIITDTLGSIVDVNDSFTRITGYRREEVLGQNPRILKSGQQDAEFYTAMWKAIIDDGHWRGEVWNRGKNGEIFAEILSISVVLNKTGVPENYVAVFTDITAIKEHQQKLEHLAYYDPLTNLPNRVLLTDRLQQAMAQSLRHEQLLAVIYLDLDGFKVVNDQHGQDVGDKLLIVLAQRMKEAIRDEDTLSCIGGDEFIAVLVDLEQLQDCEPTLERLLHTCSTPVQIDNAVVQVSVSVGVTLYPQDLVDAGQLIRHASQAMYQAKLQGKNCYQLFDINSDAAIKSQHENIEHIRHALSQNEFVLYYQPKVNMKTGEVIGVEALIRWQHPERGLLPPAAFLPIVEGLPISVELGEWVINTALSQLSAWRVQGMEIPVSVNIPALQLQQKNFVMRLAELFIAHPDVPQNLLELEILETSVLEDVAQIVDVMQACIALGTSFAMDDFGTGYSSLTYLRRLPVELLKIDQSFVRGMIGDPEDLAIVKGVIGLASAFRRRVIAEGVETIAHGEILLSLGCELAQGYGIARPMPAINVPNWVATWQPDAVWTVSVTDIGA